MKNYLFFIFVILIPLRNYAQLGNISITSAPPCLIGPGATGTITCTPGPGATGYEWQSIVGSANAIWFPNAPGPFISTVPSATILVNTSQQYYEICVRAFNAVDTTSWACVQILGTLAAPVFLPTNDPVGVPGDSGYYSIVNPTPCQPYQYAWTISGDATFNNGSQSITLTGFAGLGVNVNFGLNFSSGLLCVVALAQSGTTSDTVCMVINAPVGINEPVVIYNFIPGNEKIIVKYSSAISEVINAGIFDLSGRCITHETVAAINGQNQLEFSTLHLRPGVYFLELAGNKIHGQFKFVKTD